ncbi:hypothetical protein BT63DRAFT_302804 [Microthyrium microscopicum]|uniref:Uncharacterized protein n=1 Tax=Microthyrium microscopicum TaxID=703497 RepID=A0A6A6U7E1_9PEZI|nr:hypothetical protein BT63DRAFT_302804 [Microthyrium microscopicum]
MRLLLTHTKALIKRPTRSSLTKHKYLGPTLAVNVTTPSATQRMPLVVPGLMSSGKDKNDDWANKLMGKKIGESSDEVTFAKKDLPEQHRVVKEGDMTTMDHNPDRMNIHVDGEGMVKKVTHG